MPGIILVSVLEFMGLPHALASSSICIKVSMGKIEYQTWDKGDFSFPLTSLRDNLIVALQDADGIKISHAGVEIKSIVEKGLWDDLFPLEGGGHVHMKLQFVLSEEERSRIRMMRESALKKKQDELLNSSIRTSQGATTACSSVAPSLGFSHEVSDSQRSLLQTEGVSVKEVASKVVSNPLSFCKGEKSGAGSLKGIHPDQKQLTPLNLYEEISSTISAPQGIDVHLSHKELVEKNESKSLPAEFPTEAISSDETSLLLRGSGLDVAASNNSIPHNLGEDSGHNTQKQSQLGKSPSNVKNMISAFESGLAQDMRSPIKSPPTRSQSNEARWLCVTTGGKKVMDLMGGCSTKPKVHQGNVNLSMRDNIEKHSVDAGTVIKANKDEKACHKKGKSKPENSEDIETSAGPVGQAIKVAIMLGFGILVLLTRKRNYR
ncbi:hypothetical protein ACJW30_01G214500 [Castanea mollissima]